MIVDRDPAAFRSHLAAAGYLEGFRLAIEPVDRQPCLTGLQPLYRTPIGRRDGAWIGTGAPAERPVKIVARRGYAVGGVKIYREEGAVVGMEIAFHRLRPDGSLAAADAYVSQLYGRRGDEQVESAVQRASLGIGGRFRQGLRKLTLLADPAADLRGLAIASAEDDLGPLLPPWPTTPVVGAVIELAGRYYLPVPAPVPLTQARQRCEALGGQLAVADSSALNSVFWQWTDGLGCWVDVAPETAAGAWLDQPPPIGPAQAVAIDTHGGGSGWRVRPEEAWHGFVCQWDHDPKLNGRPAEPGPNVRFEGTDIIYDGRRYRAIYAPATYAVARAECRRLGGRLARIESGEENRAVALLTAGATMYIGANDEGEEGRWRWTDGRDVTFESFAEDEPNNSDGRQHAAVIGFREPTAWDDVDPALALGYICQWDSAAPPSRLAMLPLTADGAIRFRDRWYKAFYEALTWDDAKAHCEALGGRLVRIDDVSTNRFVRMLVRTDQPLWLGASIERGAGLQWVDGGQTRFSRIQESPPADGERGGVTIVLDDDGAWQVLPVDGRCGFVCQWDHDPAGASITPSPAEIAPASAPAEGADHDHTDEH